MKAKVLIVSLSLVILAACSKDKYNTIPALTFKSVNGTEFPQGSVIQFKLQVTDKEGDINGQSGSDPAQFDTVWLEKNSFTCGVDGYNLSPNLVPDFATRKNLKADIDITITYGVDIGGCQSKDDSCYFRFWIHDRAGHTSDTVTSPTIKLLKD